MGCAMQARFLARVVDNYQAMKTPPTSHHNDQPTQSSSANLDNGSSSSYLTSRTSGSNGPEAMDMENGGRGEEGQIGGHSEVVGNYAFSDNEMWEKMFAEAGFRLNDGVFMPEVMGS